MKEVKCRNCERYFYCMANYNAAMRCPPGENLHVAKVVSLCTEESKQSGNRMQKLQDIAANRHGRHGGNCAERYLRRYGCSYDPTTGQCRPSRPMSAQRPTHDRYPLPQYLGSRGPE
ncbi:hypothetical protein MTO96_049584 [Rhipicephalus appendiculatus]